MSHQLPCVTNFLSIISDEAGNSKGVRMIGYIGEETLATETASAVRCTGNSGHYHLFFF
ncbi:hypothetical protein SB521682_4975 [Shigella boydii 5216-82]|nr:hypothetical protein SB521682_4975 [Shigella boydii 5216-82]